MPGDETDCSAPMGTTTSFGLTIPNLARADDSITDGSLDIFVISVWRDSFERRIESTSDAIRWY
jgi:hypothetical protein